MKSNGDLYEIRLTRCEDTYIEVIHGNYDHITKTGNICKSINTQFNRKDNEFRLGLTNIITTGIVNGLMRLVETLVESKEKQLNKEQLINIIRITTYNYEHSEQLYTNALISIKEMEEGKINNFEIAGIKVSGYNPETKIKSVPLYAVFLI